ncbi:hypothetical protein HZH68_007019 [Vespula germanica]|uniref:PWWP domain-containing protein n=1 Tax=Vespula germanica TaxID=30212 RepID=A0A834K682_VESGE|nr:hypothetical protein HZH68_007019 [Vespula germanica]
MVKLQKKFFAGDKVFAKVRGYPPWPAKVEKVTDQNSKNAKYSVYFYGTGETAVCKVEELFTYTENKAKFGNKALRRKFFHEGLQQLEQELKNEKSKASAELGDLQKSNMAEEAGTKGSVVASELPTASTMDSDLESGSLIIDEGDKKKSLKRKPASTTSNNPETPELKKKRGKGKASSTSTSDTSKQESSLDSQGEESPKEIVSRSGRKIKPKRFADFSSSEEAEEHSARGRGKAKNDDSAEHVSSAGTHKKRTTTTEKKNSIGETSSAEGSPTSFESPGRLLIARTFTGEYVGIKLDPDRPRLFENDKDRMQWDWTTARKAMKLKTQLESGEILPEQVKESIEMNLDLTEEERRLLEEDAVHPRTYKLRWLRMEAKLLQLDAQIKSNLGLDRANADKCLKAMDETLALPLDPLMLKKHPHIVDTVKRLRRYVGNLTDWKLSKEEEVIFIQKAEQIRLKAEHIYNKFKAMFTIPAGQTFWQSFNNQVKQFKEVTKDMTEEKVYSLMVDPTCPDAGTSEDTPADNSGTQADTEVTVKVESEQVSNTSESPKETETK